MTFRTLRRATRAASCLLGLHDHRPVRRLARGSDEERCVRCLDRRVLVRERPTPWIVPGPHPWGDERDPACIGAIVERVGARELDDADRMIRADWHGHRMAHLWAIGRQA